MIIDINSCFDYLLNFKMAECVKFRSRVDRPFGIEVHVFAASYSEFRTEREPENDQVSTTLQIVYRHVFIYN